MQYRWIKKKKFTIVRASQAGHTLIRQFRLTEPLMWLISHCEASHPRVSNPIQKIQFRTWFQRECFLKAAGSKKFCLFIAPVHLPCKRRRHVELLRPPPAVSESALSDLTLGSAVSLNSKHSQHQGRQHVLLLGRRGKLPGAVLKIKDH